MSEYTSEMVAVITAAAPLTFEAAQEIASQDAFVQAGKGYRSVIAKAKSLDLEYIPKAKPEPKGSTGPTKAQILGALRSAIAAPDREGDLTKGELEMLLAAVS